MIDNPKSKGGDSERNRTTKGGAFPRKGSPFDWSDSENEETKRAERLKQHDQNEQMGYGGSL